MEQPSPLWNDPIYQSWPLPFQSNADGRTCLCVKQVWCLTLWWLSPGSAHSTPYCNPLALLPLLSMALLAPTVPLAVRPARTCGTILRLSTRPAAKQMFEGILVAGLAPGLKLIPQQLHKHSLGRSKEQITLYRELYGDGIISTPISLLVLMYTIYFPPIAASEMLCCPGHKHVFWGLEDWIVGWDRGAGLVSSRVMKASQSQFMPLSLLGIAIDVVVNIYREDVFTCKIPHFVVLPPPA